MPVPWCGVTRSYVEFDEAPERISPTACHLVWIFRCFLGEVRPERRAPEEGVGALGEVFPHEARALDERVQLLPCDPARRLPEAAVGIEPELVGRDVAEQRPDALGDLLRCLRLERLHVDDAGAQFLVARKVLPARRVAHAAVGALQ